MHERKLVLATKVRGLCGCKRLTKIIISTLIKNRVDDDGVPGILQYRPSDLYMTDRKETMAILQKYTHTPLHICK